MLFHSVSQAAKTAAKEGIQASSHVEAGGCVTPTDSDDDEESGNLHTFAGEFEFGDCINVKDEEDKMCDIALPDSANTWDLHVALKVNVGGLEANNWL